MGIDGQSFRQSWLWREAFQKRRSDCSPDEQEFFKTQYLSVRERAAHLVARISNDLPGYTVHDVSHLDALWDTASLVAEGSVDVNSTEAFVLGTAILLHDAAMSLNAYPKGLSQVKETTIWKDTCARYAMTAEDSGNAVLEAEYSIVLPEVLR